jgi:hypothetical protein
MDTNKLAQVLKQSAALFAASGATGQSKVVASVADALANSPAISVDQFVQHVATRLNAPKLSELSAEAIVGLLHGTRGNRGAALALLAEIMSANIDKAKLIEVAATFTGGKPVKTKPMAQQAIKSRLEQRLYLESKEALNEKVTPW